jgi:hypothetical protein
MSSSTGDSLLGSIINQSHADGTSDHTSLDSVISNANKLIEKQNQHLACDAQCEREKKLTQLREKYDTTKDNLQTAPMKVDVARKNYLEFKYGKDDYVVKASDALKKEADKMINNMTELWKQDEEMLITLIADYKSMRSTHRDMEHYKDRIEASVDRLDRNYKAKVNDTVTNDRKAYYQSQGIDNLKYWFYFIRMAYAAIVVTYLVGIFSLPNTTSSKTRYGLLVFLIIFPFVVSVIAVASFATIRSLVSKLPYNAFTMGLGVYHPALNSSAQQYNPGSVEATIISNATPHRGGGGETVAEYLGQYHPAK